MNIPAWIQKPGRAGFDALGSALHRGFSSDLNPLNHLGALTIFFFWIVLVSGIWLFIFFHTSVVGAYESVEYLTHQQKYTGGVMRSLHRYASDAAIVTLVLHIAREWFFDHHRGVRWFSWVTGVPLLWIVIPLGITGYWLVWDKLAQYVAITTAELIDWLPIFTDSMARNFLSQESLSDRFFTLMAFLHLIGLPLFLVFGIWLHVFRINRPRVNPPRGLMVGTLLAMVGLSLAYQALSQGQADLAIAPQSVSLDWYYLLILPLVSAWSPALVWLFLVGLSLLLFLAPWLPPAGRLPAAEVDLGNCNGCRRCVDDCPYGAVMMQPRSDGLKYEEEAVVDPDLCVSCGICMGACPTSTPFRKASALSPGIDLPDITAAMLRSELESACENLEGNRRVVVVGCSGSASLGRLEDGETAVVRLRCMAHLPPSFVDYVISRNLADGVFMAGCKSGQCDYRLGQEWTSRRMAGERDPQLRKRIDEGLVARAWEPAWSSVKQPGKALAAFRERLSGIETAEEAAVPDREAKPWRWSRLPIQVMAYGLFALAASAFSAWPAFDLIQPGQAVISLTFSHTGQRIEACQRRTQEELNALPPNMRKPSNCPRERHPVVVEFRVDGETVFHSLRPPSGIWSDGDSTVYARIPLAAGTHRLFIGLNDSGSEGRFDFELETERQLEPEQHVVVEFDSDHGAFIVR